VFLDDLGLHVPGNRDYPLATGLRLLLWGETSLTPDSGELLSNVVLEPISSQFNRRRPQAADGFPPPKRELEATETAGQKKPAGHKKPTGQKKTARQKAASGPTAG
jgi:hypothetical protein